MVDTDQVGEASLSGIEQQLSQAVASGVSLPEALQTVALWWMGPAIGYLATGLGRKPPTHEDSLIILERIRKVIDDTLPKDQIKSENCCADCACPVAAGETWCTECTCEDDGL